MRRIFQYMDMAEKRAALAAFRQDIAELRSELGNDYPRVVHDAIEETIRRYTQDVDYLEKELSEKDSNSMSQD